MKALRQLQCSPTCSQSFLAASWFLGISPMPVGEKWGMHVVDRRTLRQLFNVCFTHQFDLTQLKRLELIIQHFGPNDSRNRLKTCSMSERMDKMGKQLVPLLRWVYFKLDHLQDSYKIASSTTERTR